MLLSTGLEYRFDETQQLTGGWSDRVTYVLRNNAKYQITPDWRVVAKLNYALSDSSLGQVYDGGYTEGVLGWAYRPVSHDRLNMLAKYTYFYNVPAAGPVQPAHRVHPVPAEEPHRVPGRHVRPDLRASPSAGSTPTAWVR